MKTRILSMTLIAIILTCYTNSSTSAQIPNTRPKGRARWKGMEGQH